MFYSLLGVSTISLKWRIVHQWRDRCCKRDPWEYYQEICGQVKVLDAWISPSWGPEMFVLPLSQWANKASKVRFVNIDFIWLSCFVTIKFHKMFINIIVFIIIIIFIIVNNIVVLIIFIRFKVFIIYTKFHL